MKGDQSLLKRLNSQALLRLVKGEAGLSRADLAKRSGLTKSTVSLLVQDLIDDGWLCERDAEPSGALGRRPTPLLLDSDRLGLMGAEIGADYLNVVTSNLQGHILSSHMQTFRHGRVQATAAALGGLLGQEWLGLQRAGRRLLGVGVGIPGTLDPSGSRAGFVPNLGWHHVELRAPLQQALQAAGVPPAPLRLLNEANAAALSEYVFGMARRPEPLVYLSMGIGLGGGIVIDDRLYVGHDGTAGEVGHTILELEGPPCTCGRRGCAETFVSQRAVSQAVTGQAEPVLPVSELASRLARGDPPVVAAARRAGRYLGLLMQNLCNTIDPAVIVLGGPLCQLGEPFLEVALQSLQALEGRHGFHTTVVRQCRFGINACAIGAAGAVLHHALTD